MVQTTVRPVLTVLRTVRITMAAALASRPDVGSSCTALLCSLMLHSQEGPHCRPDSSHLASESTVRHVNAEMCMVWQTALCCN